MILFLAIMAVVAALVFFDDGPRGGHQHRRRHV